MQKAKTVSGEKALTHTQVKALLGSIKDLEEKALLELAISTGIRREDIVSIRQKDVDLESGKISFYEHKKKRIWEVYIPKSVVNTLAMWMKINKQHEYLFPARHGEKGHMSSKTAYNILQRNLIRAGLPKRPFHALRATCIKECQRAGWSPEQTARHVGDTIATIQRHYLMPSTEEMKSIVNEKPIL